MKSMDNLKVDSAKEFPGLSESLIAVLGSNFDRN